MGFGRVVWASLGAGVAWCVGLPLSVVGLLGVGVFLRCFSGLVGLASVARFL